LTALLMAGAGTAQAATGPIAHWKFDEPALPGTIAADSAGNFPGTPTGSATFMPAAGIAGGAIQLTRANNGRIQIGNVLPLVGSAKFSIGLWVKLPTFTSPEHILIGRHVSGIVAGYFVAASSSGGTYGAPGKAWFYASHGPGPEPISTTSVNDNTWHHIVVTRNPSLIRIYVDGAPAESTKTPVSIATTAAPLIIGGLVVGGNQVGYMDGMLDDIQIYNRVLTDTDIEFLFTNPGSTVPARCLPDITHGAVPGSPGYGLPDCILNNDDFFYFLSQFAAGNLAVADVTTFAIPGSAGYGVPNGVLNNDDFFYYLSIFAAGC